MERNGVWRKGWPTAKERIKPSQETDMELRRDDQPALSADGGESVDIDRMRLELAIAASQGDEDAFLRRTELERGKLYSIAYSYMRSESEALEMVQEAVCRGWQKRKSLREPQYYGTWLARILIRVCMDSRRKWRRETPIGDRTSVKSEAYGSDLAGLLTDRMVIEKALDLLDEQERMVIVLKYYRDMTLTDIAALLEKPVGTVKTRLHKALGKLRIELREDRKEGGALVQVDESEAGA